MLEEKIEISYPIDWEAYDKQLYACAVSRLKQERLNQMNTVPLWCRLLADLLLFVSMVMLVWFLGREIMDTIGVEHPIVWEGAILIFLILLVVMNNRFCWTKRLKLHKQLSAMRRAQKGQCNGMRFELTPQKASIYIQRVHGEDGRLLRESELGESVRVEHRENGCLYFMTPVAEHSFVVDLSRAEQAQAQQILAFSRAHFCVYE